LIQATGVTLAVRIPDWVSYRLSLLVHRCLFVNAAHQSTC